MSPPPRSTGMLPLPALISLSTAPHSLVTKTITQVHLAISPSFLSSLKAGVHGQLSPHLNRYYPPLKAILLGFDQLKLTNRTGALVYDSPAVHIDIEGTFFLFSPEVGGKLPGVVNKKSPGHLGCLVHDTFNVSLLAGDNEKEVKVGQEVVMEVTRVVWGYNCMPLIQGKLIRSELTLKVEADNDNDNDSGIDSTLGLEKVKKSKKRKREVEDQSEEIQEKRLKEDTVEEGSRIKKKKKKKKVSS